VRFVVADDSAVVREGIKALLTDAGMTCVGLEGDGASLLAAVRAEAPDVAVVDIRMPPTFTDEGLRAADEIRTGTSTAVLVLSTYSEPEYALRLIDAGHGRCGYLLKDRLTSTGDLAEAVARVGAGELVIDQEIVGSLMRRSASSTVDRLSARELEVLTLVAEGFTDRGIAERLWLTPRTVETHVRHILQKLEIPVGTPYNPRVRAVLAYLGSGRAPRISSG
jgi:DNA-binding NarL/FixJ family response regulator